MEELARAGKRNTRMVIYTVSVVVGAEGDVDVLDHGEEDEAVNDEGEDAEEVVGVPHAGGEGAGVDVQGRGADVAVEHADALERQAQRLAPPLVPVVAGAAGSGRVPVQRVLPLHHRRHLHVQHLITTTTLLSHRS